MATVAEPTDLSRLDIATPKGGWSAQVYLAEGQPPGDLAGWGSPVSDLQDVKTGTVEVQLDGQRGQAVLIWFTKLVPTDDDTNRFAAQVSGLELRRT